MKTIVLLILALTATSVMSSCKVNFISRANNIEIDTENGPIFGLADYKFCSYGESDETCCSEETVNGFEDKAKALVATLEDLAGKRDQYILDRRGDALDLRSHLTRINKAINSLSGGAGGEAGVDIFGALTDVFGQMADALTDNFGDLKGNFTKYQEARSVCMNALVEAQTAIWCYACTPNFDEAPGIGAGAISFGQAFNSRMASACYPYLEYSAGQSIIISLYAANSMLSAFANVLEAAVNGGTPSEEDLAVLMDTSGVSNPTGAGEKPSQIPRTCLSSSNCQWLIDSVIQSGSFQNEAIILGGTEAPAQTGLFGRRLEEEEEDEFPVNNGRRLEGEWTPEEGVSGITVEFDTNPGNVDNDQNGEGDGGSSSAIRNGIVACALAVVALAF